MKKHTCIFTGVFLSFFCSLLFSFPSHASQIGTKKTFGVGVSGGYSYSALSGKFYLSPGTGLEIDLGLPYAGGIGSYLTIGANLSLESISLAKMEAGKLFLPLRVGPYAFIPLGSGPFGVSLPFGFGIQAGAGLGFHLNKVPLEFVLGLGVALNIVPAVALGFSGNFAIRYFF